MPSQWSPHPVFLHPSKSHTKRGKRVCAMRASESRMFFLDDVRITYIISTFNDFAYILSEDQTSPNPPQRHSQTETVGEGSGSYLPGFFREILGKNKMGD